jgi:hypothetical protein
MNNKDYFLKEYDDLKKLVLQKVGNNEKKI